jgi:DNA repair protein RadC
MNQASLPNPYTSADSRLPLQPCGCELGALDLYDEAGCLIERIELAGDHHSLAIDLAHVVPRMLASPCRIVVLRHRHPSTRAEPSEADIRATRAFAGLLRLLGLYLHDHVIEGGDASFSFRAQGLL